MYAHAYAHVRTHPRTDTHSRVAIAALRMRAFARNPAVPVIFGALTPDPMPQALCGAGIKSNLGWSYGLEALEMGSLMKVLP